MSEKLKIVVVGTGAWGSAIAKLLYKKFQLQENRIFLLARSKDRLQNIVEKIGYDTGFCSMLTADNKILEDADAVILAIPTIYLKHTVDRLRHLIADKPILNTSKGIEKGFYFAHDILAESIAMPFERFCQLSGPNFAQEVSIFLPTASVVASKNEHLAIFFQEMLSCESFRVYRSGDPVGLELAGALKNIYAIASGVSDGLHLGNNSRAAILTRALAEIRRIGNLFNVKQETLLGLSGVGDLFLTSTSRLSRNYRVGLALAKEEQIDLGEAIAEGVWSVKSLVIFAESHDLYIPIAKTVYQLIYEGKKPHEAAINLMHRPLKREDL